MNANSKPHIHPAAPTGSLAKSATLLAVAVTLAAILATTTPAQAMRDPGPGGGPSGQYADGMNLYQYVKSQPVIALDPSGTITMFSPGMIESVATMKELAENVLDELGAGLFDYELKGETYVLSGKPQFQGQFFPLGYKIAMKKAYEDFVDRKSADPCSLEQFVLIGHSHSATAIYDLLKEGYFEGRDIDMMPAALVMIDAVLGDKGHKDLTGMLTAGSRIPLSRANAPSVTREVGETAGGTRVLNYYQTDDIIIKGEPIAGVWTAMWPGVGESWDDSVHGVNHGGLRIEDSSHMGILSDPVLMDQVKYSVLRAYKSAIRRDQWFMGRPEKWDTTSGEPGEAW